MKWWTRTRFEGHRIKEHCTCEPDVTVTTNHILVCNRYDPAFSSTAERYKLKPEDLRYCLKLEAIPNWSRWQLEILPSLVTVEKHLSQQIK